MSAPILLFGTSMLLAVLGFIFRKRALYASLASCLGSLAIALFMLFITLDEPYSIMGLSLKISSQFELLGRSLILTDVNRAAISFMYFAGAFAFGAAWTANLNRYFYSVGIMTLFLMAASLMISPFVFAAIFIELAVIGAVLLLITPEYPAMRGGLRLLSLSTIAMLSILLSGWMIENTGVTSSTPGLARQVTMLLAVGFAVLMAVPPFHLWLPNSAEEGNLYSVAFVSLLMQSAGAFFLLRFLDSYVWLRDNQAFFDGMRVVALTAMVLGAAWSIAQRNFGKAVVYAMVADVGVMLLALSLGEVDGFRLALGLLSSRMIGLIVMAMGYNQLVQQAPVAEFGVDLRGIAYRSPIAAAAALVGMLTLVGFPITAGFPGRWALLSLVGEGHLLDGLVLVLASFVLILSTLQWAYRFLRTDKEGDASEMPIGPRLLAIGGIVICVVLGVFPQIVYPWVVEAASGLLQLMGGS
jgi:formate hydrogenlyase subunit 3/multisubunit Na+/H+ antiporter MnhD subunit